ncbi:aminotransferase [Cellulomonas denverensis]|uniref:Aminotransferase class V-fold PLP-dependent enzyme n=2 Tax=Cellulomonas denverensis TaxID=264297 RepID=A0A7X6QZH1_9CELL|nr:aminotransferase class V-fold PLP-dependent enzyme [Cellulomonas denverensis]NKY23259.1 aminotransferase class V-fold PLP-dependent enzyme [Cellulomonas denverensis]GIG26377.1 aminotransferase [Cellulomonas denverensis]
MLDSAGHAPVPPEVRSAFLAALDEGWADPRRLHTEGRRARALLDGAREAIAGLVGARTEEVALAPSHTAALHSAVRTVAQGRRRVGAGIVTSAVERMALLDAADFAGERHTVPVDRDGRLDVEAFRAAVAAPGVALAAVQHANGEVGTLQPVAEAHAAAREAGVPLLVDAGSSFGHAPIGPDWDLLTLDPADVGALPGVAVLVTRTAVRRSPVGPVEDGERWFPGGVSVPTALAAAVALQLAARRTPDPSLVSTVRQRVAAEVPMTMVAGPAEPADRLPHVLTFSCLYVDGEAVVTALDREGFAVASGSACTSATGQPSHVLAAMGALTQGNVRLTLPPDTAPDDIERFCDVLPGAIARIRQDAGI